MGGEDGDDTVVTGTGFSQFVAEMKDQFALKYLYSYFSSLFSR